MTSNKSHSNEGGSFVRDWEPDHNRSEALCFVEKGDDNMRNDVALLYFKDTANIAN